MARLQLVPRDPLAMGDHAAKNLRFIRDTMERAAVFTAVPGWGGVAMGISALGAAAIASRQATTIAWVSVWFLEAIIAFGIGYVTMAAKARRLGIPLISASGRKFALAFAPAIAAGALLTLVLFRAHQLDLVAGVWMLMYGVAVIAGGAFSVPLVPAMGGCFLAAGALALFAPFAWANAALAAGFGGLHVVFGWMIARKHAG
jgi:hypothetical protein